MKKSNKGFTLVELIVVIAIIGVLAAILVPSLMGYVSSTKVSSANANAKQVYTAAATFATKCETAGAPIADQAIKDTDKVSVTLNSKATDVAEAVKGNLGSGSDISWIVEFVNGAPESCLAAKTNADHYVGSYPTEASDKCTGDITSANAGNMGKTVKADTICTKAGEPDASST